jgi:hypothetical protein
MAIHVSSYVKDGQEFNGQWQVLAETGITEVIFTARAISATVRGTGLVVTI